MGNGRLLGKQLLCQFHMLSATEVNPIKLHPFEYNGVELDQL
jgi:hypothetical protein